MLSYRHSYHAGNHADVLKHCVWLCCLEYLQRKETGLRIIDTHSGAGLYSLTAEREKNREFDTGIGKIYNQPNLPEPLAHYLASVRESNRKTLALYPGSPLLTSHRLRPQDELWLHELHGADHALLRKNLQGKKRVYVKCEDGFAGLRALVPPPTRRALVLIDPSYEIKSDYQKVAEALTQASRRFASGCYLLWYPVVDRARIDTLEKQLRHSGIGGIQLFELGVRPDSPGHGMTASGMIVLNPPWTLWSQMEETLPWLAAELGENGQGYYRQETISE